MVIIKNAFSGGGIFQAIHLKKYFWKYTELCCRYCHARPPPTAEDMATSSSMRTFGILAHIDAGKTTTTERMLFYSGKIKSMGEVHDGNTVTDYMEQERNRGITITSASVSFFWKNYLFNLVDTPGHVDFTMEVEQTLSVLDGSIIILDATAGVEAQTQTVWYQGDKYKIPRIVYVNKMDRPDASLSLCVKSLHNKFDTNFLVTQVPIFNEGKVFDGVVDLISMKKFLWLHDSFGVPKFSTIALELSSDGALWETAVKARGNLVDLLSGLDDTLAEEIIEKESIENVSTKSLSAALRRCTILQKGVPILCGSSYKNKGVQPLMDAVIRFLPSPLERSNQLYYKAFQRNLCAQAFKIVHHRYHGPLVFLRILSGEILKNQKFYNMRLEMVEPCTRIFVATADDFEEVSSVGFGNIAVVAGLHLTMSGDILTSSASSASTAVLALAKSKDLSSEEAACLLGTKAAAPQPVFYCAVEAPSQAQQVALEKALARLHREDPSLSVSYNEETSQMILGGMGELHLDIIKERLVSEYKLDVLMGPMHIAYREKPESSVDETFIVDHVIGSSKHYVRLEITIIPKKLKSNKDVLQLYSPDKEIQQKLNSLSSNVVKALRHGVTQGLLFGPKLNCPLVDTCVQIRDTEIRKGTSDTMVNAAAAQCVRKALTNGNTRLLEPVMDVEVITAEKYLPLVVADISRRRGSVYNMDVRLKNRCVGAKIPLAEMQGYSTALRILTSGLASFNMEFSEYQCVTPEQEDLVIKREAGFSV